MRNRLRHQSLSWPEDAALASAAADSVASLASQMATAIPANHALSPFPRHYPIGISTGYLSDLRGQWQDQVDAARAISPFAAEISALSEPELGPLLQFLSEDPPLPFRYLSVHGPAKERQLPETELVDELRQLPDAVAAIVMHPDTMQEPEAYAPLGARLVLENMDARKPVGQTPEQLAELFRVLPDAGFCFDVAHAHSVDPSMSVATELLDAFLPRLRHLHVSSLSEDLKHIPLSDGDTRVFMPLLMRCRDVPWILEAFAR